jgi:hypothetical protein
MNTVRKKIRKTIPFTTASKKYVDGGNEFKYDISDTLWEPLYMSHCIPTQHNNKEKININKLI